MNARIAAPASLRACVAALVALCFFLFADSFLAPPDCLAYWSWGQSLFEDLDFSFLDEYVQGGMHAHIPYVTEAGRLSNDWPMGTGLLLAPGMALGRSAVHAAVVVAVLSALFLWWKLVDGGRSGKYLAAAAAFAGTPLLFYTAFGPFFSHPLSFALNTLFLVLWARTRRERSLHEWGALGFALGLAALVRPQNLLLAVVFPVEALAERRLPPAKGWFAVVGATLFAFAPQLVAWQVLNGNAFALPKIEEMLWFSPQLLEVLFSDWHGIVPWTPVYAIGAVGLVSLLRTDRTLGIALIAVASVQLYINAANAVWWSGGSFGNRRLADSAIVIAFGVLALWNGAGSRGARVAVASVVGACIAWTAWLMLAERRLIVPLDRYVPLNAATLSSMTGVFTEPVATLNATMRLDPKVLLERLAAAIALGALAYSLPALYARLRSVSWPTRTLLASSFCGFCLLVCLLAALRTPPTKAATATYPRRDSGILFDAWVELAQYHVVRSEWEVADAAAQRAIAMGVPIPAPHFYRGVALAAQGRPFEGAAELDRYLVLSPNNARVLELRDEFRRAGLRGAPPVP